MWLISVDSNVPTNHVKDQTCADELRSAFRQILAIDDGAVFSKVVSGQFMSSDDNSEACVYIRITGNCVGKRRVKTGNPKSLQDEALRSELQNRFCEILSTRFGILEDSIIFEFDVPGVAARMQNNYVMASSSATTSSSASPHSTRNSVRNANVNVGNISSTGTTSTAMNAQRAALSGLNRFSDDERGMLDDDQSVGEAAVLVVEAGAGSMNFSALRKSIQMDAQKASPAANGKRQSVVGGGFANATNGSSPGGLRSFTADTYAGANAMGRRGSMRGSQTLAAQPGGLLGGCGGGGNGDTGPAGLALIGNRGGGLSNPFRGADMCSDGNATAITGHTINTKIKLRSGMDADAAVQNIAELIGNVVEREPSKSRVLTHEAMMAKREATIRAAQERTGETKADLARRSRRVSDVKEDFDPLMHIVDPTGSQKARRYGESREIK